MDLEIDAGSATASESRNLSTNVEATTASRKPLLRGGRMSEAHKRHITVAAGLWRTRLGDGDGHDERVRDVNTPRLEEVMKKGSIDRPFLSDGNQGHGRTSRSAKSLSITRGQQKRQSRLKDSFSNLWRLSGCGSGRALKGQHTQTRMKETANGSDLDCEANAILSRLARLRETNFSYPDRTSQPPA